MSQARRSSGDLLTSDHSRFIAKPLAKSSSVILAESGQKVQRSNLFFNSEFESFHDDSFNNEDESESTTGRDDPATTRLNPGLWIVRGFNRCVEIYSTETFKTVLKCSIAYLIASMGVYWTPFDNFLGSTDSKHVVATTAVYFHPSRTKGSMHQLILFVMISLLFTFIVSLSCRTISTLFFNHGEDEISFAIDLVISSVALGFIAFMKQKVNKQTFNVACSLASISLVTCIVKEGSLNSSVIPMKRLISTAQVVVAGSCISVLVCYTLWPKSAVNMLRDSLNDSFNIMSLLISITTHRFLNNKKFTQKDAEIFALLQKKVNDLKGNLEEAKFELRLKGRDAEFQMYTKIVAATMSLLRHLQALKASCEMQWHLLHVPSENAPLGTSSAAASVASENSVSSFLSDRIRLSQSVENIGSISSSSPVKSVHQNTLDYNAMYSNQLFDLFVYYLGPSTKLFVFTVKEVLSAVPFESKFVGDEHQSVFVKSSNYQASLTKAIHLFEEKQSQSFDKLYAQDIFKPTNLIYKTDQEEVTAMCGNFTSLMTLYGKQLIHFLQLTEHFELVTKTQPRSWSCLKFWDRLDSNADPSIPEQDAAHTRFEVDFVDALKELKSQINPRISKSAPINESTTLLPKDGVNKLLRERIWESLYFFRRADVQFGFRVGVGAFCVSLFAFLPQTKHIFVTWRLEWTLVIYCIMMNKSLGGTTMTVKWRFMGTFLGAMIAWSTWQISDGNLYVLATTGFLLSLPCFYIIIYWKRNNAYGRFILLTYNLTALYSYSMVQKDSEDKWEGGDTPIVGEIASHRFISVSLGILWALFVSSFFIPITARARLKSGLTVLWLRMGVIWNSDPLHYKQAFPEDKPKLVGLKDHKGTLGLLSECQTLLKQAPLEFRLRGSFPKATYEKLLESTSTILNAFQNMKLIFEVDPYLSPNEEYVLKFIESEREELEHRVFLIFYMIASALALGFPLPAKPASTEHAMDRLLIKLNDIKVKSITEDVHLNNEDYVLLYTYILVTSTITGELDRIIENIKHLLGNFDEELFFLV